MRKNRKMKWVFAKIENGVSFFVWFEKLCACRYIERGEIVKTRKC